MALGKKGAPVDIDDVAKPKHATPLQSHSR